MRLSNVPNPFFQLLFVGLLLGALVVVVLNQLPWFFLLLLLLFLILLIWFLFYGRLDRPKYPPEEFYVTGEVIIRGPAKAVESAVGQASGRAGIELSHLDRIDYSELEDAVRNCLSECSPTDFNSFVIDLYSLTGTEKSVAAAIRAINDAVGRGSDVRAEPNWLSGYPWEPTGSPWEPTGSPWEPTGSANEDEQKAPSSLFMEQWAFKQIELDKKVDSSSGRKVRIGILDTSPFEGERLSRMTLDWVAEPTPLTVTLNNRYRLPEAKKNHVDLSSHGVFAAGLAHAIAPNAEVQMIRVLNKNNLGDLYYLLKAIFEFIKENTFIDLPDNHDRYGAVLNMSLGVRVPPDEAGMGLPLEVQSMRDLLQAAKCAGIMVVAASGNNSANMLRPEPANLPANWPEILSVAASDQEETRACFSNQGNIGAPGGDGKTKVGDPNSCEPANKDCAKAQSDCKYSVIGPVLKTDKNTGFAYWSGTSFSTPMVAGLAACVIEMGRGKLSPDAVRHIIECGAKVVDAPDIGNRIINVPATLNIENTCWTDYRVQSEPVKAYQVKTAV